MPLNAGKDRKNINEKKLPSKIFEEIKIAKTNLQAKIDDIAAALPDKAAPQAPTEISDFLAQNVAHCAVSVT